MYTLPMLTFLAVAAASLTGPMAAASAGDWTQEVGVSKMDDSRTVVLSLSANAAVHGWPEKVVMPTLKLRCREGKVDAYVIIGMAAAVEYGGTDSATVRLRFDKEPAQQLRTSKSTNGEALFFGDAKKMITTMARHQTLLFRFTPFNSVPQETSFSLYGLSAVLKPLQEACGWDPEKEAARAAAAAAARQGAAERAAEEERARKAEALARQAAAASEAKARAEEEAAREAAALAKQAAAAAEARARAEEEEARRAAAREAARPERVAAEMGRLERLLRDLYKGKQPKTRRDAARMIRQTIHEADREAVAGLLDGLKDPHWGVRQAVVDALGSFGAAAAPALPQLEQLAASDPSFEVQGSARAAITSISR